ncbi:alpha/beta hydrolase [Lacticaseibacillus kribbianus]|uniref:alpha/beta hydrolase n=1 Tax=Lacticaseibacillus kribbianus TaxID=2926292 RepID=UPI001CD34CB3|nr:alpha/beta hydrolase-fold protein [Lacticaseibacillus kribbianus]
MTICTLNFQPASLGMQTRVNVVLPDNPATASVLLLLHGHSDDENSWLQRSRLAAYADDHNTVVIMPRVDRSFYADQPSGIHYYEFVSRELLARCKAWFNLALAPARTFVGGLSMGGYGALKIGLNNPDQFAGIYAMSSVPDLLTRWDREGDSTIGPLFDANFGSRDRLQGSVSDVPFITTHWQDARRPFIRMLCGTEDSLYPENQAYAALAQQHGFDCQFESVPGDHEWAVWDYGVQEALADIAARDQA